MGKKCEICGYDISGKFSICKNCKECRRLPDNLRIKGSFYKDENKKLLKKEVYIDMPYKISKLLAAGNMGRNKLRAFFSMIRIAYDRYSITKNDERFEEIKSNLLQRVIPIVNDRTRRGVTPGAFKEFIENGLQIVLKDNTGKELYGFKEHFMSVIAYSKEQKGGS